MFQQSMFAQSIQAQSIPAQCTPVQSISVQSIPAVSYHSYNPACQTCPASRAASEVTSIGMWNPLSPLKS